MFMATHRLEMKWIFPIKPQHQSSNISGQVTYRLIGPREPHPCLPGMRLVQKKALRVHTVPNSHVWFWLLRQRQGLGARWGRGSSNKTGHMHNSCKWASQGGRGGVVYAWWALPKDTHWNSPLTLKGDNLDYKIIVHFYSFVKHHHLCTSTKST